MGALSEVKSIEYVSDNPRRIGGITFNAVRSDIVDTVDLLRKDQAGRFLKYTLSAAINEYAFIFGHDEALKELQCLIMLQEVVRDSELKEAAL